MLRIISQKPKQNHITCILILRRSCNNTNGKHFFETTLYLELKNWSLSKKYAARKGIEVFPSISAAIGCSEDAQQLFVTALISPIALPDP